MSTITKEFTKEQLIEQAKKNIEVLRGAVEKIPGASDAAVIHLKLAEITLASLEAEPVAITDYMAYAFHNALSDSSLGADEVEEIKDGLRAAFANVTATSSPVAVPESEPVAYIFKHPAGRLFWSLTDESNKGQSDVMPVYSAPPAPVTINAEPVAWLWSHRKHPSEVTLVRPEDDERAEGAHWSGWSCQALYAAPPATESVPDYPEVLPCPVMLEPGLRFGKGVNTRTMLGALQRRAEYHAELEAMTPEQRAEYEAGMKEFAAMLQGADGKPELTVWYGSMPETNGKTNWTAMLHRKGQHPWEGITIERSEYPDRVRYKADRMRHLIGELSEEPDILEYDSEAHSGYVKPGNSPVIPDGWVILPADPTQAMMNAWLSEVANWRGHASGYRAMIAAAPKPEA